MQCKSIILAILASSSIVSALPIPDNNCIGSSFSPTNCNSPNSGQINVDPTLDISPAITLKEREEEVAAPLEERDGNCIGSSFSPTNCNSPNSNQINVDPDVDVSPTVDLSSVTDTVDEVTGLLRERDNNTIGSSFSPTNKDSPNSNQANVKPDVKVDPTITTRDVEIEERDGNCIGSSFSPTNCNSPGSNQLNVDPNVDVSPSA